jgi:hypothetical protein
MPSSNAYYNAELAAFLRASTQEIIGALASNSQFSVEPAQRDAWLLQVSILQSAFVGLDGTVFLEFVVPRIGSRLDVVLISGPAIFAIEFKVGESDYRRVDINQVWDYALDLKNFHKSSHDAPIIPMLVATEAPSSDMALPIPHADGVYPPTRCNPEGLAHLITHPARSNSFAHDIHAEPTSGHVGDGRVSDRLCDRRRRQALESSRRCGLIEQRQHLVLQ